MSYLSKENAGENKLLDAMRKTVIGSLMNSAGDGNNVINGQNEYELECNE